MLRDKKLQSNAPAQQRSLKGRKLPKSPWANWLTSLGAIATLIGGVGLIGGGAWLSIQLMINPDSVLWLNRYLPEWTRIPLTIKDPPQTLDQIQSKIKEDGLIAGETVLLGDTESSAQIMLPVLSEQSKCQTNCQQIVELRVYQPTELEGEKGYYRLVSQLTIPNLEEAAIIPPQDDPKPENYRSSRSLPLTKLSPIQGTAIESGFWFNLLGKVQGDTSITYGQVIHYNPSQNHLSIMLSWSNRSDEVPYWQEVTGGDSPELVINQTVGLEPNFLIYQIKPQNFLPNPIQLEEIYLDVPALVEDLDEKSLKAYRNSLLLAKNGLWSPALQLLQSIKNKKPWSAEAQAQIDAIALHAKVTQEQAKTSWASPNQQVIANIIDGRWQDAIKVFQAADVRQRYEIGMALKADSGPLWSRIETALKVNSAQPDAEAWGAMTIAAKDGLPKAIAWVRERPINKSKIPTQINQLLDQLDAAFFEATAANSHFSQIIGSAKPLPQISPADWLQPNENGTGGSPLLQLEANQTWYQIQVSTFNDGQRWRQQPFANLTLSTLAPAKHLWRLLGLDTDPQIQITIWKADGEKQTTLATVKAAQIKNGAIELLASGEAVEQPNPTALPVVTGKDLISYQLPATKYQLPITDSRSARLFANTEKALAWVDTNTITLADLYQVQSQWVSSWLPKLWLELQKAGKQRPGKIPSLPVILQSIGYWSVQPIDITGNNQPDAVLTVYEDVDGVLKSSSLKTGVTDSQRFRQRTLIFTDSGKLVYNEFTKGTYGALVAIANLGESNLPALVIDSPSNYTLKRWSNQYQRFD